MHLVALAQLLVLVTLANGAPVVAKRILGNRFACPVDGGALFFDGYPLFGTSKTIRGILLALTTTAAAGPLLGLDWRTGLLVGASVMAGDLVSSFTKRRLGMPAQSKALGLDQTPEVLFPLLACRVRLGLGTLDILVGVAVFFTAELLLSRLLFRLRIRERPY